MSSRTAPALSGFAIIDKPAGLTSHDVVARIRRACGRCKTGHAGTLDPMATGVLVVCLGVATRLAEWASNADKRYLAEITLGTETTTFDAEGQVIAIHPVSAEREDVEAALRSFVGEIDQRPPAFSAIKMGGRPLYDLARRGEQVEAPLRRVTIHSLDLVEWRSPRATVDVVCSKGTYVRSLAHDLGRILGCGAHLSVLRRTASGRFSIQDAAPLERTEQAIQTGRGAEVLHPPESAVLDMPRLDLTRDDVTLLRTGRPVRPAGDLLPSWGTILGRAHEPSGELIAIVEWRQGVWWPKKVLTA